MMTLAFVTLAVLATTASAQMRPPPGERGGPSLPPPTAASHPTSGTQNRTETAQTETVRLLTLSAVQKDLRLTSGEINSLGTTVKSLKSGGTEDTALSAVSRVLTSEQTARLKELLVQDLGYASLELTEVRAALTLTSDQETAIAGLVSSYVTTTQALATTNPASAQVARAKLQTQTMESLAKLLTPEQDAKLRNLAGRALGT